MAVHVPHRTPRERLLEHEVLRVRDLLGRDRLRREIRRAGDRDLLDDL